MRLSRTLEARDRIEAHRQPEVTASTSGSAMPPMFRQLAWNSMESRMGATRSSMTESKLDAGAGNRDGQDPGPGEVAEVEAADATQPPGDPVEAARKIARNECGTPLWTTGEPAVISRHRASVASDPS